MNLETALQQSYTNYLHSGARSTEKLLPLHKFLGAQFKSIHNGAQIVTKLGDLDGELKAPGAYYPKNVDIAAVTGGLTRISNKSFAVQDIDQILGILGVKFVSSNFKQNANNYFENMMGETANIQAKGIPYSHFIAVPIEIPYFNNQGQITRLETLSEGDLKKYVTLMAGPDGAHKPAFISFALVKYDLAGQTLKLLPDSDLDLICQGATKHLGLHHLGIKN